MSEEILEIRKKMKEERIKFEDLIEHNFVEFVNITRIKLKELRKKYPEKLVEIREAEDILDNLIKLRRKIGREYSEREKKLKKFYEEIKNFNKKFLKELWKGKTIITLKSGEKEEILNKIIKKENKINYIVESVALGLNINKIDSYNLIKNLIIRGSYKGIKGKHLTKGKLYEYMKGCELKNLR